MERKILHVDVNNAFLSWTAIDRLKKGETLDIRTIPAVIGGDEAKRKGVVLAKSNIAKQFGIKSGEPIFFAKQKCPQLRIFETDFSVYKRYSDEMYKILLNYTYIIERYSIDECFLDITHFLHKGETALSKADEISKRIKQTLGFTVNIGVANNKVLAKMASDFQKPDRIHTLYKEEIPEKMWPLPIGELFMVGKNSISKLQRIGIKTIGDLAKYDYNKIAKKFGKNGNLIWNYANGIDNSEVFYKREKPKGVGNSVTLPYDFKDLEKLNEALLSLADQVSYRLRKNELQAKVINVQIKNNKFEVTSHQKKLDIATDSTRKIYEESKKLLCNLYKGVPIRLIGIRVDNLSEKGVKQISLFENEVNKKQENLDKTLDSIKRKYGYNSISRAGKMNIENIMSN